MEIISVFLSGDSECFNCHRQLRFKRCRKCKICRKAYVGMIYCADCSIKIKKNFFSSERICVICNNKTSRSIIKPIEVKKEDAVVSVDSGKDKEKTQVVDKAKLPTKLTVISKQFLAGKTSTLESKDPEDYYDIIKKIGEGGSGVVYIGIEKSSGKKQALKSIQPKNDADYEAILNEVTIFSISKHPNILELVEAFEFNRRIWLVTELLGCSLTELIADRFGKIPEQLIAYICKEIIKGLSFLHSQHRIHRDVKSDNVLLGLDGKIKLADLGYAVQLIKEKDERTTVVGTPSWMAPEIAMGLRYNVSVDIWSLGIVALEMADGEPPLLGKDPLKIINNIVSKPPPSLKNKKKWSAEFNRFVEKCLKKESTERPSADELLSDPFILTAPEDGQVQFSVYLYSWINSKA